MVREFPYLSAILRQHKYVVPHAPRPINVGNWKTDEIENIARSLKCVNLHSCIYDNNVSIYVPDSYNDYWGCSVFKIMFCMEDQKGYLCWYDEQERKYNKLHFIDNDDLVNKINIIHNCE
jgi:uncharacterized protein (UPF0128 family)